MNKSTIQQNIIKSRQGELKIVNDTLAVEEPLEISISSPSIIRKNISITMRTPGNDEDLAVGFLFTEGIISQPGQIEHCVLEENKIVVQLNNKLPLDLSKIERHFYTSSSCGVCGKASIDSIRTVCNFPASEENWAVNASMLHHLPQKLQEVQNVFKDTGGIHAAALFDLNGTLLSNKEDVGRHNALDKLIGHSLMHIDLPLDKHLLLLSGRASFELIQKAAMAGIQFIMAVGAPSSLAVELAKEFNITLVGFLNNERFNIYSERQRING
jgi:FdhD protein